MNHRPRAKQHSQAIPVSPCPSVLSVRPFCLKMSSKSLADRFAAVTEQKVQEDFMKMSYAELADLRITFGEAKVNQRYIDVVQQDPKYVKWFTQKYQKSEKMAHRTFLFFIQLYVERMELTQGKDQANTPPESPQGLVLHAKSKSAPRRARSPAEISSWTDEELSQAGSVENVAIQQEHRLNAMESTLSQIAHQVQMLTQTIMAKNLLEN